MNSVKWYYLSDGFVCGPVTNQQLIKLASANRISANTPTCRVANRQRGPWMRAGEIGSLFDAESMLKMGGPICGDCGHILKNGECVECSQENIVTPTEPRATIPIRSQSRANDEMTAEFAEVRKYRNLREYIVFVQILAWTILSFGTAFLGQGIIQLVTGPAIEISNIDSVVKLFQMILPGFLCCGSFVLLMAGAGMLSVVLGIEENTRRAAHFSEQSCRLPDSQRSNVLKKDLRARSA